MVEEDEDEERPVLAERGRSVPPPARVCGNSFSIFRQKSVINNIWLRYAFQFDPVQFLITFIL